MNDCQTRAFQRAGALVISPADDLEAAQISGEWIAAEQTVRIQP